MRRIELLLVLLIGAAGCRERGQPPPPPAGGPWRTLMNNGRALVSLDTTEIEKLSDGRARVHLRYAFDTPLSSARGPERIFTLESTEITECENETARAESAILFDSIGQSLGAAGNMPGAAPPSMIGDAGPPLCAYLRKGKFIPPDA